MASTLEMNRHIYNALMRIAEEYVRAAEKVEEIEKRSPDYASVDDTRDRIHSDSGWNYWVGRMAAYYDALREISSITSANGDVQRDKVCYFIDAARMNRNA